MHEYLRKYLKSKRSNTNMNNIIRRKDSRSIKKEQRKTKHNKIICINLPLNCISKLKKKENWNDDKPIGLQILSLAAKQQEIDAFVWKLAESFKKQHWIYWEYCPICFRCFVGTKRWEMVPAFSCLAPENHSLQFSVGLVIICGHYE